MEWSWGRGLAHTDPTRFNKKIICENLWLKKHQFNPLKPNLHLFKNIKIGVYSNISPTLRQLLDNSLICTKFQKLSLQKKGSIELTEAPHNTIYLFYDDHSNQ